MENKNLNAEVVIIEENGYDIENFLCRCPVKSWEENV